MLISGWVKFKQFSNRHLRLWGAIQAHSVRLTAAGEMESAVSSRITGIGPPPQIGPEPVTGWLIVPDFTKQGYPTPRRRNRLKSAVLVADKVSGLA